jgi:uncharacterized protein
MVRKLLKQYLPTQSEIRKDGCLRMFGRLLHDHNLWHLQRDSVALAVSIGLFLAFVPIPFQMVLAAGAAIVVRCNLPIAVAMVWVSNPLTIPPLFFAAYKVGAVLLDRPTQINEFELSADWVLAELVTIWQPLLLGCLIFGLASATVGNITVRLLWRLHVARRWRERRERRLKRRLERDADAIHQNAVDKS